MFVSCLWWSTLILWLGLHGWFSRVPPQSSMDVSGCATREQHLWTVELCWLSAASIHVWGEGDAIWWAKQKCSCHPCSWNWFFSEYGTDKKKKKINEESHLYKSTLTERKIEATPRGRSSFRVPRKHLHLHVLPLTVSYTAHAVLWSLINSAEALMLCRWHSRQDRGH